MQVAELDGSLRRVVRVSTPRAGHTLVVTADVVSVAVPALVMTQAPVGAITAAAFATVMVAGRSPAPLGVGPSGDLRRATARLAVAAVAVALLAGPFGAEAGTVVGVVPWVVASLGVGRLVSGSALRVLRRAGMFQEPVVILGRGEESARLARVLRERPELGARPVLHVEDGPEMGDAPDERLPAIMDELRINRALLVSSGMPPERADRLARQCARRGAVVDVVSEDPVCAAVVGPATDLDGSSVRRLALGAAGGRLTAKRTLDVLVAVTAVLAAAPLLALLALAVRLSGPGPVFFRQDRVGLDGRRFQILKFRSLGVEHCSHDRWLPGDGVTWIGRLMRPLGLDELPQLVNVLRGEMSLVGPRPERPAFVEAFSRSVEGYAGRHRVRPGLTGWAQVNRLRGDTCLRERSRFDNRYIAGWSLAWDLWILALTPVAVLRDAVSQLAPGARERLAGRDAAQLRAAESE